MNLKKYNVTVKRFNPMASINDDAEAETFILPVDSPDEEHAVSAAMSNAVAFTTKVKGNSMIAVAFCATAVHER